MRTRTIALALMTFLVPACDPEPPAPRELPVPFEELQRQVLDRPCDSLPLPNDAATAVAGVERPHNEIHDCQRLVIAEPAGRIFGPLVGAYPLHSVLAHDHDSQFPADGIAIATIFNWGSTGPIQHYPHLGIFRGWSCLFVRPAPSEDEWEATIARTNVPCDSAAPPTGGWNLRAFRQHGQPDAIPRTARWGFADGKHYLGIRCGPAWCTIGPPGTRPTRPSETARRRGLHPGWYDEQHIGIQKLGSALEPGPLAFIYPTDTLLALRDITDDAILRPIYENGLEVAVIEVHGALPADRGVYQRKFNLSDGPGVGRATIWVRIGSETVAAYRNGVDEEFADVTYLPNIRHGAAGSVRWRWHETDETAWIACRSGCCDVVDL